MTTRWAPMATSFAIRTAPTTLAPESVEPPRSRWREADQPVRARSRWRSDRSSSRCSWDVIVVPSRSRIVMEALTTTTWSGP